MNSTNSNYNDLTKFLYQSVKLWHLLECIQLFQFDFTRLISDWLRSLSNQQRASKQSKKCVWVYRLRRFWRIHKKICILLVVVLLVSVQIFFHFRSKYEFNRAKGMILFIMHRRILQPYLVFSYLNFHNLWPINIKLWLI